MMILGSTARTWTIVLGRVEFVKRIARCVVRLGRDPLDRTTPADRDRVFGQAIAQLRALDRHYAGCIYLVGVYLSDNAEEAEQMRALFPRLIHASPRELPGKLGDLLAALG